MINTITFDGRNQAIVVQFLDGTSKTYTDRLVYAAETGRDATDFDGLTYTPPTQEVQFKVIERAIEQHMDAIAKADNWDNRWTCVARAGYANPWQNKGIAFGQWMDSCWQYIIQEQQKIVAGTRLTIPTPAEAIAELPVIVW